MPEFPSLKQNVKTDVLIVGGGMTGILCAWMLEQQGVNYTLIEADRICGGVTRNTTAKITSQHGLIYQKLMEKHGPEIARKYWKIQEKAIREYRKIAKSIPCDFENQDNAIYMVNDRSALEREMTALEALGIPAVFTEQVNLPFPVCGAIRFAEQAQFHPLKLASELSKGLHIFEQTPAREFVGNRVLTAFGTITAGKIIMATHFPLINKHGCYFLKMYQQRSYVLALENAQPVEGMLLDGAQNGLSFRNFGGMLLLGGGGHRTGKPGGGWEELEGVARRYYPESREVCRWATQDCITLDGMPYIGRYSKRTPDLFVATGFNKWGMTNAMAAAMILSDLVQGKENPYAEVFRPSRSIWHRQLFCNGWEASKNLLTPTKPRCPHLGCALKWNSRERSWDCPCHGSRFGEDGELLDNPATGNMKQRGE